MSAPVMLSVQEIFKTYRVWHSPASRLTGLGTQIIRAPFPVDSRPNRWLETQEARLFRPFEALHPLSFELRRGETMGVVGKNGSGKSTLLQIIAGTLQPTGGSVWVGGKIAALLELGSGFSPEFTGRENVYLNGAILGLSREQIEARMDDILAFADIGTFIDQPVKTYSSGMVVRLAFSVQVQVEPDILIVDEALSVGDAFFQHRCVRRMEELLAKGMSLIFVSHDSATLRKVCAQCLLLERGRLTASGDTAHVLSQYTHALDRAVNTAPLEVLRKTQREEYQSSPIPPVSTIPNIDRRLGDETARILGISIHAANGEPQHFFETGDPFEIRVTLEARADIQTPLVGLNLYDKLRNEITATNTEYAGHPLPPLHAGKRLTVTFLLTPPPLAPGIYSLDVAVNDGTQDNHRLCDWIVNAAVIELFSSGHFHGRIRVPAALRHCLHA